MTLPVWAMIAIAIPVGLFWLGLLWFAAWLCFEAASGPPKARK